MPGDLPTITHDSLSRLEPLGPVQRLVADRMMQSHLNTARVSILGDADATQLVCCYEELRKALASPDGPKITYTPVFVHILAHALRRHPEVNTRLEGVNLCFLSQINIGIALTSAEGQLMVPVIRNADELGLLEITRRVLDLRERVNARKVTPADMQGGTFTVTNLGMFSAISHTTPLINPPQCAILGVGRIADVLQMRDGRIESRKQVGLSLTHDHRILNGLAAGAFFQTLADLIADPRAILAVHS